VNSQLRTDSQGAPPFLRFLQKGWVFSFLFPFSEFLPKDGVKKVQIDHNPKRLGRRTPEIWLVGEV
jgi:hypothetical protein